MLRIVLGIIVGIVIGSLVFMAFQAVNTVFFPLPDGVSFSDQEGMTKFISEMPPTGFILVFLGYAVGSTVAGFLARKISRHASIVAPILLGAFFSLGWIMNISTLQHPIWAVVVGFFMFLPFSLIGHKFASD